MSTSNKSVSDRVSPAHDDPETDGGTRDIRRNLVDAAVALFYEHGYEGTGVQDIVDRAQCTKGALYHYFRSKEDLLAEILDNFMEGLARRGQEIRDQDHPPITALELIIRLLVLEVKEQRPQLTVSFLETRIDGRRTEAGSRKDGWRQTVTDIIRDGQQAGEFRADIDPAVAVWATFGMAIWAAFNWFPDQGGIDADVVSDMVINLIIRGLGVTA